MNDSIAMRNYMNWLNSPDMVPELKSELRGMVSRYEEIEEWFATDIDFGTAGLRAPMGAGSARMNVYTVASATFALATCLIEDGDESDGLVISYDSRNNSKLFAETAARVAAEAGVRVRLSDEMRPVPMLSYAVRYYGAAAGIMITASHNPPEYNGLKIYGADGGQIKPEKADRIKAHLGSVQDMFTMLAAATSIDDMLDDGRVECFGEDIDEAYNDLLKGYFSGHRLSERNKADVRIVYTPLNGSGAEPVRRLLSDLGYTSVFVVPEQEKPDGDFSTLRVPNPEFEDTFELAIKYAGICMADVIIATDPDSDRLGVAVPDMDGIYRVLSGNQIGLLLLEYLLSVSDTEGTLSDKSFCVTSIVSSSLSRRICDRYGISLYETLTGSKYVADLISRLDENGDEEFIFGFEEGNGYIFGKDVRDKDAVRAAAIVAEMAAVSKAHGHKLFEQFDYLCNIYGYACEKSFSITREGLNGQKDIQNCMDHFRSGESALESVGVAEVTDYLPEADVLYYRLKDHRYVTATSGMADTKGRDWIAIRPSGTEPKLKVYVGCYGTSNEAESRCRELMDTIQKEIYAVMDDPGVI